MLSKITIVTGVILILAVLSLAVFANSMTKRLAHDEHMYCMGGALLADGKMIYRDFSYVAQMPYHALLYAVLFKTLNTHWFLLVGRIVSVVCDILVAGCILGISLRELGHLTITGLLAGVAAVILWLFNPLVDYAIGFAWNHDVVLFLVILSLCLSLTVDFRLKSSCLRVGFIGALLTFASCMRITTVVVQLAIGIFLLIDAFSSAKKFSKTALSFLAGCGIVLIWPVWVIASAPQAFLLNLIWIPALNGVWLRHIYKKMQFNRIEMTYESLINFGCLAIIITGLYLCVSLVLCRSKARSADLSRCLFLSFIVTVAMFVIAYIPSTTLKQYFAMPLPFAVICLVLLLMRLKESGCYKYYKVGLGIFITAAAITLCLNTIVLRRIPLAFSPKKWVPVRIHRISEDIASQTKQPKLAITIGGLYAIEGGLDCPTEFSAGPFVYRIANFLTPEQRNIVHAVSTKTVCELTEKSPPSVLIVGIEPKILEQPLLDAAVKPEWQSREFHNGVIAYFKP